MVDDHDPALRVNLDAARVGQTFLIARVIGESQVPLTDHVGVGGKLVPAPLGKHGFPMELGDVAAIGSKYLHPVVHPVGNVDVAIPIHGQAVGTVQLTDAAAGGADGGFPFAVGGELLDAVVTPVSDVDVAFAVERDAPRIVELAVGAALFAELADVFAV